MRIDEVTRSSEPSAWLYVDEICHRALNDYAAMLATVHKASRVVSDPAGHRALEEIAGRLRAGATAQSALRPPLKDGRKRLDLELEQVCTALSHSFLEEVAIGLTLFCEPLWLDAGRSWRFCLVVSELVRNAARHAFAADRGGEISIDVRMVDGALRCAVLDNGGAPSSVEPGRGSAIVDGLAADMGAGVFRRYGAAGSTIILVLPNFIGDADTDEESRG